MVTQNTHNIHYKGIDESCIFYMGLDNDCKPLQLFFGYDISSDKTLRDFTDNYTVKNMEIQSIELCVSVYSKTDNKIEAVITYDNGEQDWIDIAEHTSSISGFIDIMYEGIILSKMQNQA
ncbi:MAG: hypothetical protein NC347_00320 [Clostridium sp.]|nr:hypothetical protein [Clostridium sp.]